MGELVYTEGDGAKWNEKRLATEPSPRLRPDRWTGESRPPTARRDVHRSGPGVGRSGRFPVPSYTAQPLRPGGEAVTGDPPPLL
jgi:hypothetical protein